MLTITHNEVPSTEVALSTIAVTSASPPPTIQTAAGLTAFVLVGCAAGPGGSTTPATLYYPDTNILDTSVPGSALVREISAELTFSL